MCFPGSGIEPVSPILAGSFLTNEPLGKPTTENSKQSSSRSRSAAVGEKCLQEAGIQGEAVWQRLQCPRGDGTGYGKGGEI